MEKKFDAAAYMKKMFMKNHVVFKKFIMQDLTEQEKLRCTKYHGNAADYAQF